MLACCSRVVGYRIFFAETFYALNLRIANTKTIKIVRNRLSTLERQCFVLFGALCCCATLPTGVVGVTYYSYVHIGVGLKHVVGKFGERRLSCALKS